MKKSLLLWVTLMFLFTLAGHAFAGGAKGEAEAPKEEEAEAPKAIEEAPTVAPGPIRSWWWRTKANKCDTCTQKYCITQAYGPFNDDSWPDIGKNFSENDI